MILEIDVGNTWAKWRLLDGIQIVKRGRTLSAAFPQEDLCLLKGVRRVRCASVSSHEKTAAIVHSLASIFGIDVELAETAKCQAGLTNGYQNPAQMGVDRWLAMLAAFNAAKCGCLVVSCGTAVTIDSIRDDGMHEGGYILPGLMMMRDALLSRTGRIQYHCAEFDVSRVLGDSTARAVEHGAVNAVLSAIEHACDEHVKRQGSCNLFITGGDAPSLAKHLSLVSSSVSCHFVEDLVLNGLQHGLP